MLYGHNQLILEKDSCTFYFYMYAHSVTYINMLLLERIHHQFCLDSLICNLSTWHYHMLFSIPIHHTKTLRTKLDFMCAQTTAHLKENLGQLGWEAKCQRRSEGVMLIITTEFAYRLIMQTTLYKHLLGHFVHTTCTTDMRKYNYIDHQNNNTYDTKQQWQ